MIVSTYTSAFITPYQKKSGMYNKLRMVYIERDLQDHLIPTPTFPSSRVVLALPLYDNKA